MNSLKSILRLRIVLVALLMPCLGFSQGENPISIDFPGGPLSKFVETVRADNDTALNIIDLEKLDPVLPAFSFQNQYPEAIINALSAILEPQGYFLVRPSSDMAILSKKDLQNSKEGFAAFQLGHKLRGPTSINDVTAAIQAACEFSGRDSNTLRFKFHPGTKMLFVAGPQITIDHIVRQVIASLPDRIL